MRMRTESEIKAYVDGYNACFNQFCESLKGRKSVVDAIKKMKLYQAAVNNVVEKDKENIELVFCKDCKYVRVYGDTTKWFGCDRFSGWTIDPNAFCSYGERKGEEDDKDI